MVNAGSATVDVLDLRNPSKPTQVGSLDIVADLAPRAVGGANSVEAPGGKPLLIVGNEVSGTTTVYEIRKK